MKSVKIAITGASGYIGSHVVDQALRKGYDVRILVRADVNRPDWAEKGVEVFKGDIRNEDALIPFLTDVDYLIHCAAVNTPSSKRRKDIFESNVDGVKLILRTAKKQGVKKIVYTGSSVALGCTGKGKMINEETVFNMWNASSDYARSKYLGEKVALELFQNEGVPVAIAEPTVVIGPGDVKPTYTGILIMDLVNGKIPAYFDTRYNFVDVRDVACGHLLILEKGKVGERYLLCGNDNILVSEYFNMICEMTGKKPRLVLPLWMVYPMAWGFDLLWKLTGIEPYIRLSAVRRARLDLCYDNAKAKKQLDFNPRLWKEAIRDELQWMIANGYLKNNLIV
ncbi:MAG: NAD-dependent epimerase/dehydratase family protein [Prevotellaceae bacterium]|jgi:dihydroflavonol-4-reductase|nr:NAD-dependent epimerase/dehydratase family protein [Prevotellaceae bacterium]